MSDRGGLLVPAAALLALAAVAVLAWSPLLGGLAAGVLPVAALAAPVLGGRRPGRLAAGALAAWLLAAPLIAGVPAAELQPGAWTALPGRLAGGLLQLTAPDGTGAGGDRWPLAAGLALAGTAWIAAAALARRRRGAAFAAAAAPWVAAALLHPVHTAVWQGAAVLLAGLLWHACPRAPSRAVMALSVIVALASAITAQAAAPHSRWLDLPGWSSHRKPQFRRLETDPTFAALDDRRSGAPMLDIKAARPALWRMQVLDVFDGHGWRASWSSPRLPEPAARPVTIDVRVRGLRDDLVASPGAVEHVAYRGDAQRIEGAAWRLSPAPRADDGYRVDARVVRVDPARLARARPPADPRVAVYTRLGWRLPRSPPLPALQLGPIDLLLSAWNAEPGGFPIDVPPFGAPRDPRAAAALARTPYHGVAALASRLTSGARTEWQAVARVIRYLRDGDRFRYTTAVGAPGRYPLADFLLRTHAGYCQHFAGAAALLLRLVGIPARMVAGFATGVPRGGNFEVRDVDAHDWIEVYFGGYGWVPFNPTPATAQAAIPPALELVAPVAPARLAGPPLVGLAAALGALAIAGLRLRRRPRELGDALARLLGPAVGPSTTLGELGQELARVLGPHTAALAAEAERDRFAPPGAAPRRWATARVARALARDVGPVRAAVLLAGAASAGARASHHAAPSELA